MENNIPFFAFIVEKHFWEDEVALGKLMKEYIAKIRKYGVPPMKDFEGYGFLVRAVDEDGNDIK